MATKTPAWLAVAAATVLSACSVGSQGGSVGEQLGFDRGSPDEFLVIAREPLQRPPSFDLPRPQPGAPSRVEPDPLISAQTALLAGEARPEAASASAGEQALLRGAGADVDNSDVRERIAAEDPNAGERRFGLTSLAGFAIPATLEDGDDIVEPRVETEALRSRGLPTPSAPPYVEDPDANRLILRGGN
ncbi:MAG: DUF3035 domain-containing protein [Pseudomonadota bacterium]